MTCLEEKNKDPEQHSLKFQRLSRSVFLLFYRLHSIIVENRVCNECYARGQEVYIKVNIGDSPHFSSEN